jgi:MraZ protein
MEKIGIPPLTSEHTLENGRITLPSKFRKKLVERDIKSLVIGRGYDRCLCMWLPDDWKQFIERMNRLPRAKGRVLERKLLFGASEEKIDRQGRLLIPPLLREYASLSKEILLIGLSDRIEIWDKKRWEDYDSKKSFEEIGEELDTHTSNVQ